MYYLYSILIISVSVWIYTRQLDCKRTNETLQDQNKILRNKILNLEKGLMSPLRFDNGEIWKDRLEDSMRIRLELVNIIDGLKIENEELKKQLEKHE